MTAAGPRGRDVGGWSFWRACVCLAVLAGGGSEGLTAQQTGPVRDTIQTVQTAADSARMRQIELLRDLARGPGADSARLAADSARLAPRERPAVGPPPPPSDGDTILGALLTMPGYAVTRYSGQSAEYMAGDGVLLLHGDSTTRAAFRGSDGTEISSDSVIRYEQETGLMTTWGDVVSVPATGDEVRARYLACNLNDEECQALQARTQYSEGAEWYVTSDLPVIRTDLQYGHKAIFTSCEEEEPHYHFEADQLKIVRGGILVAKPVRLYFADVPVAWLPFIAQSLSRGRASGILTPTFSVNDIVRTSGGYRRRVSNVGFYWAMNDYMDATVALDWFDNNYTAVTGRYRYNWVRQFLQGGIGVRQFWRSEGGQELTLDTNNSWQISERTSFRMSARYASSSQFVTRNSFNPQEVTQSIDSEGGFNHRFDWGNLAINGNRRQFLSDDRVETTFPSASLSLKTITLFPAPPARAGFFNNITWSGGARFSASSSDLAPAGGYTPGQEDRSNLTGSVTSGLSLGGLSLSGGLNYRRGSTLGVRDTLPTVSLAQMAADGGIMAFYTPEAQRLIAFQTADSLYGAPYDVVVEDLSWSSSLGYQQRLVGSTTLTPRVSFTGSYLRSDLIPAASSSFVAGPVRTSFGATLKTDLYGFFPGVGGFERIRHKISPSFTYDWAPEVTPTPLQQEVYGSRVLQPRNVISVTLNQTFEAKRASAADTATTVQPETVSTSGEPRRLPQAEIVNLLGIRTSAVRYDFVEADSANSFLLGFETLQLTNQITSDLLRGLTVSMTHSLFEDVYPEGGGPGTRPQREFKPKLTQMNLGFSLNNRSGIFRLLGFGRGDDGDQGEEAEEEDLLEEDDALSFRENDEASMIPMGRPGLSTPRQGGGSGGVGQWSAQISYALNKPRTATGQQSQMVQASLRLKPTEMWEMSWRTSYDLEGGGFNDHVIRLSRDLHRWRANFDFLQTATGNWSFRFEVTLLDNEDLKFDYQQRNVDRVR